MPDSILPPILVELADRVIIANRRAGRTIAVAESCTGGLVSAALTEIAGSSDVFEAGFVTYSNDMKAELLKVSHDVLETFGAVSIATASRAPTCTSLSTAWRSSQHWRSAPGRRSSRWVTTLW